MPARTVGGVHWADLDGLRALAILLVFARHSLRPFISEDAYQAVVTAGPFDLTPFLLNGWVGVDLFFVLSGFLIGRQAWRSSDGIARFWFKRATRILPAYFACLAVIALGLTASGAWPRMTMHFLSHIVMLQDYTGSVFVPAFWSLGAEEKFYLLTPLVVLALMRLDGPGRRAGALAVLWLLPLALRGALAWGHAMPVTYETYFPLYRSPFHLTFESLVLGFAIAWASVDGRLSLGRGARETMFWGGVACVAGWLVPFVILRDIGVGTIIWAPAIVGLGFGAMVLAAVSGRGSYSRVLGWPALRPIATGSYTLYLTHMMITPVAVAASVIVPLTARASVTEQWVAFLPWYLALSLLSAFVLHRLVERPVLQWRDRVLKRSPVVSAAASIAPPVPNR